MKLRGIIFDLDGTLGDTTAICIGAFRQTYAHFRGISLSDAEVWERFGPTEEGMVQIALPDHLPEAVDMLHEVYEQLHESCTQPFPGVFKMLERLKKLGIRSAIVTGKGPGTAEISLRRMGLTGKIDRLETGFPDRSDKPNSIRSVLADWSIPPGEAGYLGDTPGDMLSARQAGVIPLGAAWASTSPLRQAAALDGAILFADIQALMAWIESQSPESGYLSPH